MTTKFYKLNISDKTKEDIIKLKDEFYCDAINLLIEQENIDTDSNEDLLECCYITLFDIIENN